MEGDCLAQNYSTNGCTVENHRVTRTSPQRPYLTATSSRLICSFAKRNGFNNTRRAFPRRGHIDRGVGGDDIFEAKTWREPPPPKRRTKRQTTDGDGERGGGRGDAHGGGIAEMDGQRNRISTLRPLSGAISDHLRCSYLPPSTPISIPPPLNPPPPPLATWPCSYPAASFFLLLTHQT